MRLIAIAFIFLTALTSSAEAPAWISFSIPNINGSSKALVITNTSDYQWDCKATPPDGPYVRVECWRGQKGIK